MITNKDVRIENGNIVINGDKYPLDGQSPEAIMQIVKDNSDTTPTVNSDKPITSGGVFTALAGIAGQIGDLNFAVFEQTFSDVDINTQWGSLFESSTALQINISSLGLQTAPKLALIGLKTAWAELFLTPGTPTSTAISFRPLRPTATTGVTLVVTALVIY